VWSDAASRVADEALGAEDEPLPVAEEPLRLAAEPTRRAAEEPAGGPDAPYQSASAEPARPVAQATETPAPASPPNEASRQASRAPATPAVSAAPPSGLAVQVGAFAERRSADLLIARLGSEGFPAYAVAAEGGAWRVRVGPYRDRGGAERAAARLKREQKLPTWVLEENAGR